MLNFIVRALPLSFAVAFFSAISLGHKNPTVDKNPEIHQRDGGKANLHTHTLWSERQ